MNPHLTAALARLNERRGVHWGGRVAAVTERDLAPKTRKAIEGLTEAFELELKDDGQVYLVKPGSAISADAATVSPSSAVSPAGQDGALYYARGCDVFKRPVKRSRPSGGVAVRLGFKVCRVSEDIGAEGAESVAQLLTVGEDPVAQAAPDLLEALRVVTEFAATTIEKLGLRDTNGIIEAAHAAIAKAEGQF